MKQSARVFLLATALTIVAPLAMAQTAPNGDRTNTVVTDDDRGFDEWGLLGLLGLAGLMGRKKHDTVHRDTMHDTTRRT